MAEPKPQSPCPMKNVGRVGQAPTDLSVLCVEEEKDTIERWEGSIRRWMDTIKTKDSPLNSWIEDLLMVWIPNQMGAVLGEMESNTIR